jgi:DNA-binding CsgD family transcriptional regulator
MGAFRDAPRAARERVAELAAAAHLMSEPQRVVALAVEALKAACPRGKALAFTRFPDGRVGAAAIGVHERVLTTDRPPPGGPMRWIVDLDHVPAWQRDRWIEPIAGGVHGPDFFDRANPVMHMIDETEPPDYGRMMVCQGDRLLAWIGLYVDGRRGFAARERAALEGVAAEVRLPLRIASALQAASPRILLAPRQNEIVARVARGFTNKQIARDLGISPATVKTLLERLFRVSRAPNRAALVQWWRDGVGPETPRGRARPA